MTTHFTDFNKPFEYKCAHDEWVPAKFLCMRKNKDGNDAVILFDRGAYEYPTNVNSYSPLLRNKVEKKKFWTITYRNRYGGFSAVVSHNKPVNPVGYETSEADRIINIVEGEYEV